MSLVRINSLLALGFIALPAHPQALCDEWNTQAFMKSVAIDDLIECIDAGFDANARDESGTTPLRAAVYASADPDIFEALLNAGADLEAQTDIGFTPYRLALLRRDVSVVEVLYHARSQ